LDRRLGGPQNRSGQIGEEKILDHAGTRIPTPLIVQPVASGYTDYVIPTIIENYVVLILTPFEVEIAIQN
jgi:hypothetical protein